MKKHLVPQWVQHALKSLFSKKNAGLDSTPPDESLTPDDITQKEAELKAKEETLAEKEKELKREKETLEQEKSDFEELKRISEEKQQEKNADAEDIAALKKIIEEKESEIQNCHEEISRLKEKIDSLSSEENIKPVQNDTAELLTLMQALQENVRSVEKHIIDDNGRLIKENEELQNKLDSRTERLESINQAVQEDRYRKDKIKLINKYIYQMDIIRRVLYDFENDRQNMTEEEAVTFLQNQLKEIIVGMEATLTQEMVERIQNGENGASINLELQETIGTVKTNDVELDGKIYRSISPGYVWTLPYILKAKITDKGDEIKSYRFLIRAEQVITYKFKK